VGHDEHAILAMEHPPHVVHRPREVLNTMFTELTNSSRASRAFQSRFRLWG
jgi:hypothetical protein